MEKLPIKFFAHREIDEMRVEGARNSEIPKWVLTGESLSKRSAVLFDEFNSFTNIVEQRFVRKKKTPFVFVAKMCSEATSKSKRRDITTLFKTSDKNNVIGLSSTDELVIRIDSLEQMNEIGNRIKDYNRNSYALSCLEKFYEFQPLVQIGSEDAYKIKLIDFQDYEINIAAQRQFEQLLTEQDVIFKKTYYTDSLPVYKIENNPKAILDELIRNDDFEMLFSIEPMPKYLIDIDSVSDCETVDIIYPDTNSKYETLGILDNGIKNIPHLRPWVLEERWSSYPENLISATHGTFVAGVALYGDVLEGCNWVGHKGIKLFDATVFPDASKEGVEEDELIENIREAISANYEKVKIWNLSISITREVTNRKFSDFAVALDDIQEKYNVLICKSAGNCKNFVCNLPKGRIHEGADSVRSLVVGSMAHAKGARDYADIDNPSPFTRVGPGPEFIIKPEVSHYGGNAGVTDSGKVVQTGVKSFSSSGGVISGVGTSFSTPRIAALATGLAQEIEEDFDPLLIKGLIVHSANYPKKLTVPQNERTNQVGFGIPNNVTDILYNNPYEVTLILRDILSKGEYIDIMDFPMPKSLIKDGYFTGQIIVTLVYDPILDYSQGVEYCQSNVDVKFGSYDEKTERDISKRNILNPIGRQGSQNLLLGNLYSKRLMKGKDNDFALRERLLIQYADKYYPVKKYAVDLSELSDANKENYVTADKRWFLTLRGLYREHTEQRSITEHFIPSQEICLILTIRDPEKEVNVYDDVTNCLEMNNFWHSNIKVSSDVHVVV